MTVAEFSEPISQGGAQAQLDASEPNFEATSLQTESAEEASRTQEVAIGDKATVADSEAKDEAQDKVSLLDFLAELPESQPRELPEPSSVFKDETGSTVCRYRLPDVNIETWLGLWYERQTDADTKSGIKVSHVRLLSFSMHTQFVEAPKPWKATASGGFATFIVQEKASAQRKYQVYVAACELMRGGYTFEVDITVVSGDSELAASKNGVPVTKVAKERPSTAMRQRLLGNPIAASKPRSPPLTAQIERTKVQPVLAHAASSLDAAQSAPVEGAAPLVDAAEAKRKQFMQKLAEDRRRREEESGAKRIERQQMLEADARKKAEERKQRVTERTPMRTGRSGTPLPVVSDWRQRISERTPCRVSSR